MECSQAVWMLMLLVPCEQPGGKPAETVIAERLEAPVVVQAEALPANPREAAPHAPATDCDALSARPAAPLAEPAERAATPGRADSARAVSD